MVNVNMHVFELSQEIWGNLCLPYKIVGKWPNEFSDSYHNVISFLLKKKK